MFKNYVPIVNHSLKYNPSIDGLRGVAVSLVLLFHIWPAYFSFGYVGVDIFFVLSGYLITQIIYIKLENNTFSLKEFYRNRVRRIFPSLIIVLLVTTLIGYLFLLPSELKELARHIKSSAFFYENFRLIGEQGYWDESSTLKPLLHFWSLAIEEQFYIFWPLVLVILYKIRINIPISLSIFFLTLFLLPLFLDFDIFYHTFSRAWELSLGGLIFILSYKYIGIFNLLNKYKLLIYIFFFISICFSINNITFSTSKTLLVVLATALLILSLSYDKSKNIFSNPLLVFLGLISFPLYLWHYVLISYGHIFSLNVENIGLLLISISIFLSYITYRYIEINTRNNNSYNFAIFLFLMIVVIGFIGNFILDKNGLPNREHLVSNNFEKQFIRTSPQNDLGVSLIKKVLGYKPTNDYLKSTSDDINKQYILVIGDSHAHTSYPGFALEFKKYGYETLLLANSSCPPYLNAPMGSNDKDLKQCKEKIRSIYKFIDSDLRIEKIILATRHGYMHDVGFGSIDNTGNKWNYHYEEFFKKSNNYNQKKIFFQVVEDTFSYFHNKKSKFYYLIENPELGFSPKNCLIRPFDIFPNTCKLSMSSYLNRASTYRNYINSLSKKYQNTIILDPKNFYCDDTYCYAIKDGKMLYADDDHHSVDGSVLQAKYFIKSIMND